MAGRPMRYGLLLLALCLASPALAADTHEVKCAVNQDRVWVYESLNSFDVEARLRCGEPVEIVSRVKGFVKIRTVGGVEGYVPDSTFPGLPPLPDDPDKPSANGASPLVAASMAAHATAASSIPDSANASAKPAPAPVAVKATAAIAAPAQPAAASASAASPRDPMVRPSSPTKSSAPVKPAPPTNAPVAASARVSTAAVVAKPASAETNTSTRMATAASSETHIKLPAPSARATASMPSSTAVSPRAPVVNLAPAATVAPVSARLPVSSTNPAIGDELATTRPAAPAVESEDYPDAKPENESADPSCHLFFSAYGLAPSQFKWLAENRRKEYAGICPAPDLGRVDFVILFAHDSDTYSSAMPAPVHTDRNGFSDFSPLTTVDTALIPASEVEKARYEFVWVFRMKRGDFDPAKFSQRRRPQFTTYVKGSHAPARVVEDAFGFIQEQTPNR
jgi:hypothetical protein